MGSDNALEESGFVGLWKRVESDGVSSTDPSMGGLALQIGEESL